MRSRNRTSAAEGRELIVLLAMATALTALGIDLMLPAFDDIRSDFDLGAGSTAVTGLVTAYFVGLGLGTVFYGPLADHKGRRWTMRLGLGIYVAGALLAAVAPSLPMVLLARFLWGMGAAGPRVVALAIVRDRFEGDAMSRTMSSLMAVFILVPVFAPTLGAVLLEVAPWRWLFVLCAASALLVAVWTQRLPETLAAEHRIPDLRFHRVKTATRLVLSSRTAVAYAAATVALYGVFASYLGSSEAIIGQALGSEDQFPLIFGVLAGSMGVAAVLNGRIVSRFGTASMVRGSLSVYVAMTLVLLAVAVLTDGQPGLAVFMPVMALLLASHAQLLPNLNTLAMAPMASVAGTASSVIGAAQLTLGALLGGVLDRFFDGTILPLAVGFVLASALTVAAVTVARRIPDEPVDLVAASPSPPPDVRRSPRRSVLSARTRAVRGDTDMDFHFASAWERVADAVPDVEAVVMGDQRWTYAAFDDAAARLASAMEAAGVGRGAQVSLYLHNCPEYLIAQQAAFKHGCGPVNVNYRYLDDELVYLVENSDSEVLVFHASLGDRVGRVRDRLERVKLFVVVDDDGTAAAHDFAAGFHDLVAAHDPQPRWERSPEDLYMLYTGGTTGLPKGVMYDNGVFCNALLAGAALLNGLPAPESLDDVGALVHGVRELGPVVSVPCCPLMHGTGMWVGAMPALNVGGTVVLLQSRSFDADELLAVIEAEGVTRCAIVGDAFARPILRALEAAEERGALPDLSSLKTISSSGAMWSAEIKDGLTRYTSAVLSDGLGSTEGGGYGQVTADRNAKGTTARFTPTPDTLVLGPDDLPVAPGSAEPGLLATRTGAHGYYKDPEKTARTFKQIDGHGYVITGDWATLHEDGSITLHGRGSNCINSGGEKIFPEEVEEALKTHPAVDDCYVVGVPDDRFGQRVVAVAGCASAATAPPSEDDLRDHLREVLASYKIPRQIVVVDHVQRAPNGKADYGWARDQVLAIRPATSA